MTKRFKRAKREKVRLTERDLKVVEAVFEARYMTNRQVGRLLFGNAHSSHCRQRLRYPFDLDYLRKRPAGPNDPDIYYLGLKGRRYIASAGLCNREMVDKVAGVSGEAVATPALMMRHDLSLSRLYVNAQLECRRFCWELAWKNTRELELGGLGIQPDAWLEVSHGKKARQAYLEFTAAMPNAKELSGKLDGYHALWNRTREAIAVLWLTTSRGKANRLLGRIRRSEYRDYFVGQVEEARSFLTACMWRWGDAQEDESDDMVQWLRPPADAANGLGMSAGADTPNRPA